MQDNITRTMSVSLPSARHRMFGLLGPALVFLALLVLWALVAAFGGFESMILPSPWAVALEGWILFTKEHFHRDVLISVLRQFGGFGLACLVSLPLGFVMGMSERARRLMTPLVGFTRFLPVAALVPLLIIWLGIGDLQKVALLFLGVFPFLVSAVADEVSRVPSEYIETAQTLGATRRQVLWKVLARSSAPGLWESMRILMGIGWTYIVVAELVGANAGIGARIIEAQRFMNTPRVIAGILVIGALGALQDLGFRFVGWLLFPWNRGDK